MPQISCQNNSVFSDGERKGEIDTVETEIREGQSGREVERQTDKRQTYIRSQRKTGSLRGSFSVFRGGGWLGRVCVCVRVCVGGY